MTQSSSAPGSYIVLGHTPAQHVAQMMMVRNMSTEDLASELDIAQLAAKDFLAGHYIVTARLASHLEATFGMSANDWMRWDREARAREACRDAIAPSDRLSDIFAFEQAWWARQQAWGRVVRIPPGKDQNEAWEAWLACCRATEQAANTLAGDETGHWRTAFYNKEPE